MFRDGTRVIMLIHRSKDGATCSGRHLDMVITQNEEDFSKQLEKFEKFAKESDRNLRVYSSANKRDMQKGIREFKRQQLDVDYGDTKSIEHFYSNLNRQFVSCLSKPQSRAETIFLIDVDSKDLRNKAGLTTELEEHTKILSMNQTKNGYHIFTEPFNPNLIDFKKYHTDFHKDGLVLWYW